MSKIQFLSMNKRGLVSLLMCMWAVFCCAQCAQDSCSLKVDVSGFGNSVGTLYGVLYDKAGYLKEKLQIKTVKVEKDGTYSLSFEGLQKGSYGVVMFLDENGNGKTDRNGMGMPNEMIGFSNNAPCSYGPPSFGDVEVSLDGDKTIKVEMYYFHL